MVIRRQKLDRKAYLKTDGGRLIDMPSGWSFSIDCPHHGKISFDFNPYRERGRDELAGHIRNAFWSLRHELVGKTLKGYHDGLLRGFWRFLDDLDTAGESITRLDQIDRQLLDRYLTWLELQIVATGTHKGQKWSVSARKNVFGCIKTLLTNRQKQAPEAVSPSLTFSRNPFPNSNQLKQKREPYSDEEQKRILNALNSDLKLIHTGEKEPLPDLQVLAVHLIILGLATGCNLQPLLELRRDSIQEYPLPDRELLVTFKRRGYSTHVISVRRNVSQEAQQSIGTIPANIADHFRYLCEFTAPLINEAMPNDRDFVLLWRVSRLKRKGQVIRLNEFIVNNALKAFVYRHSLKDERGCPLNINISRLRPTMATELYRRTRDIRRVQKALGHANIQTIARQYVDKPLEAERDHAIVLDGMVSQFSRIEIEGKVLLAADNQIPLQNVKDLLAGGYNTGIARCRNPFRDNESVCKKFFACFTCPNMCVFEDDLWRLFSFYYRLLAERAKINPIHWQKTYGRIIRRIDTEIAPQFPAEKVNAARIEAQTKPHPTWRGPLL